jgi:integrase/recombinase XerD
MDETIRTAAISPLRQRLIDDMNVRRFSPATQRNYVRDVGRFATFLGRSPDTATVDDVCRFQIEQRDAGVPAPTMNSIVSALRFFFTCALDRPDLARRLIRTVHPRNLPVVLSQDEVARLLNATTCLKHQAALSVAYGSGLRVAEVAALKVTDVDSERMLLRVERGKGGRYRNASLARARELLAVAPPPDDDQPENQLDVRPPCPCCGGHMIVIETFARWSQPRAPPHRPGSTGRTAS